MSKFGLPPEEASIVSVTDRVTKVALNAPASAVHFLGDVAAFVGTEENVTLATGGDTNVVVVHGGGILCSTSDGKRVVMGGDDGKLVARRQVDYRNPCDRHQTPLDRQCRASCRRCGRMVCRQDGIRPQSEGR